MRTMRRRRPTLTLLFLLSTACGESGAERGARERREAAEAERKGHTLRLVRELNQGRFDPENYTAIEVGMTFDLADAHLGGAGREVSTKTENGTTTRVVEWGDRTEKVTVTFTDGKVTSKSKS